MEFRQAILPPPPPPLTSLRASIGALWFRVTSAVQWALRLNAARVRRSQPPMLMPAPLESVVSIYDVVSYSSVPMPKAPRLTCPLNDKWFRNTQVLEQAAAR